MTNVRDCSVGMVRANLVAVTLTAPIAGVLWVVYAARWGWAAPIHGLLGFLDWRIAVPAVGMGIVAHEALHAIGWALASGRPLRAIAVGIHWKTLTPYAHPREPMAVRPYRIGGMVPGLALGLAPAAVAIALGWSMLLIFALVFTLAAGGDVLALWLIRGVPNERLVQDHPSRVGCVVLE
ncbi:MAG TPA: DUF3267 domain-containing protein [Gemmatimonadales bacterium]|nr:DUF3267 domain-containing protein [Gemmatimonadales bacterium]